MYFINYYEILFVDLNMLFKKRILYWVRQKSIILYVICFRFSLVVLCWWIKRVVKCILLILWDIIRDVNVIINREMIDEKDIRKLITFSYYILIYLHDFFK